ncbi:MAG: elongation factor Ts [Candidatus Moraniibacteriota bacterium]|nr:MAG: elongation factor Ts [Candidatus Moranbacteria bacterium]
MGTISLEMIKQLREMTGAGVVDVKKALDEAKGDEAKAIDLLKKRGQAKALKKSDREAKEGIVASYIHSNARIGVLVKLLCETDFVARNEAFAVLGRDIAMHVAAMNPRVVSPEEVNDLDVEKERIVWREQLAAEKKPEAIAQTILAGKEKKFREEAALLTQSFVKDPSKTVGDVVTEAVAKMGERIQVGGFVRFDI